MKYYTQPIIVFSIDDFSLETKLKLNGIVRYYILKQKLGIEMTISFL